MRRNSVRYAVASSASSVLPACCHCSASQRRCSEHRHLPPGPDGGDWAGGGVCVHGGGQPAPADRVAQEWQASVHQSLHGGRDARGLGPAHRPRPHGEGQRHLRMPRREWCWRTGPGPVCAHRARGEPGPAGVPAVQAAAQPARGGA
uniref:Putative secreted protein n=1 Tax=Ixodes ricinus TaxID=34613 RepID=A0A147BR65_IXORI